MSMPPPERLDVITTCAGRDAINPPLRRSVDQSCGSSWLAGHSEVGNLPGMLVNAVRSRGILKKDLGRGARAITSPARGSGEIPERLAKGAASPKSARG